MQVPGVALGGRARRALALMGLALVGLAAAATVSLRAGAGRQAGARAGPAPVLTSLDWLSATSGWAVLADRRTYRSALFRTTDGGRHWARQFSTVSGTGGLAPSFASQAPLAVRFLDGGRGLLTEQADPNGTPALLRSADGGADWSPLSLPDVARVRHGLPFFLDLDHGWVVVDGSSTADTGVYRTDDGGRDWSLAGTTGLGDRAPPGERPPVAAAAAWFRNPLDGWLVRAQPDGSAAVIVTHDGGAGWRQVRLPDPPGGWRPDHSLLLEAPRVSADGRGALVVADLDRLDAATAARPRGPAPTSVLVYTTSDGGDTWLGPRPAPTGADPRLGPAAFVDGVHGWLVGRGSAWVTRDAGRTWTRTGGLPAGWSFAGIAPVDGAVAVAQVATGPASTAGDFPWRLRLTRDGGRTWRDVPGPPAPQLA